MDVRACVQCGSRFRGSPPPRCPLDGAELRELPDPMLALRLAGRYALLERIGTGGMGAVYRARDEVSGRDVAVKLLHDGLAKDPSYRERFVREARTAARLDHENIVAVHDAGATQEGLAYMVMELLDGETLTAAIARGPLEPPRALRIALDVCAALARAHELDVLHRDVKPDNVFLARVDGRTTSKLLDFGLAQVKGERRLTQTGVVHGTPEYMAPEQARGAPLSPATDLYALGCVLFEMLTGERPYPGSGPSVVVRHLKDPVPLPSSRRASLGTGYDGLVGRLLAKDARERYRDAHQVATELRALLGAAQLESTLRPPLSTKTQAIPLVTRVRIERTQLPETPSRARTSEIWRSRVDALRTTLGTFTGSSARRRELESGIARMGASLDMLTSLQRELESLREAVRTREEELRGARLRIGHALDELGRDESRLADAREAAARRVAELREAQDARAASILERIRPRSAVTPTASTGAVLELTRELAEAVRDCAPLATEWLLLEERRVQAARELEALERQHEDLRFQIDQLKGRLAILTAERELEIGTLRARIADLDVRVEALVDSLTRDAALVADALGPGATAR
ncbi:MAG: protein kinase [Myxococcota bacterium]|nr:protein kinase [Myxococcota bacterium]